MNLRAILLMILAGLAFGTVACGGDDGKEKECKPECTGGKVCDKTEGVCKAPSAGDKECKTACGANQTCDKTQGKCVDKKPGNGDKECKPACTGTQTCNKTTGKCEENQTQPAAEPAACKATPAPERCGQAAPANFGYATKLTAISFPTDATVGTHANGLGANLAGVSALNVNTSLKDALADESLVLVLEYSAWVAANSPADEFYTFLWTGKKGSQNVDQPPGTKGSFSAAYLEGTKITVDAISTTGNTFILPLAISGLTISAEVADAHLEGKVTYETDKGVKLEEGMLYGKVMKKPLMDSIKKVATNTCAYCLEADGDWFKEKAKDACKSPQAQKDKDNQGICEKVVTLSKPAIKTIFEGFFEDQVEEPNDSGSVVINLAGEPFKIEAFGN